MLEQSEHECDNAIARDPGTHQFRSCAWAFSTLGKTERAMDFLRLDAGSEWAATNTPSLLLRQGKVAEARESEKDASRGVARTSGGLSRPSPASAGRSCPPGGNRLACGPRPREQVRHGSPDGYVW